MDRVLVGVDIPKDSFSAAGLDAEGNECFSGSYSMDSDGFCKFLEILLTGLSKECIFHFVILKIGNMSGA